MSAPGTPLFGGRIFPGLRPFEQEDALLFFGRENQTDDLLRRLDDTRFIAVVGLSGSGKSSLVRAGLLPALYRGHLSGAGPRWHVAVMRPGSDPLRGLARLLDETLGEREDRLQVLRSGSLGLLDSSRQGRAQDENLLLVVDQFEEIFRFQSSDAHWAIEPAEFVGRLLAACREYEPDYRVYVVVTLRSDYLGECARFSGLPEALNESQYLVPRMTPEQLREAIEGPAALGGGRVAADLLDGLLERAGVDPDQLPVLQHLLMRMWEVRARGETAWIITEQEYGAVGGWEHALDRHADEVFVALSIERQGRAERIFRRLTGRGRARREDRQPASLKDLAAIGQDPSQDETRAVVEHFRGEGRSFLTSRDRELTGDSVIDIGHESLIRRWERLREWVEEEKLSGEWYRRVEERVRFGGAFLSGPELEAALSAREKGHWNRTWAERYSVQENDAGASYEDVVRFLEESAARRTDELTRVRRTRTTVAIAAVSFAVVAAFAGYFGWSASKARAEAERLQYVSAARALLSTATEQSREGEDEIAALLARQSYLFGWPRESDLRAKIDESLRTVLARPYLGRTLLSSDQRKYAVAISADGRMVASGSEDGAVSLASLSGAPVEVAEIGKHKFVVLGLAFSLDGRRLASLSQDEIVTWDIKQSAPRLAPSYRVDSIRAEGAREMFTCLALSPDGRTIAAGTTLSTIDNRKQNEVRLWESGQRRRRLRGHGDPITSISFNHDGTLLAAGAFDKSILVWDLRSPGGTPTKLTAGAEITSLAFSPTNRKIAAGSERTVWVWGLGSQGDTPLRLTGPENRVQSVTFHSEGREVVAGSMDRRVYVWDLEQPVASITSPTPTLVLRGHRDYVMSVASSSATGSLVSASFDGTVRLWEPVTGTLSVPLGAHDVLATAFSPRGERLATGGDETDRRVRVWDLRDPSRGPTVLSGHDKGITAVAFSGDVGRLASGGLDNQVWVWALDHPQQPLTVLSRDTDRVRHAARISALGMDGDGSRLVSAGMDGALFVWNLGTGEPIALRESGSGKIVTAVAFSPEGRRLATGESNGTVALWDLSQRPGASAPRELEGDGREVTSLAFSHSGQKLASASEANRIRVWDDRRPGPIPWLTLASANRVTTLAFSPDDDSMLAAGTWHGIVNLWDLAHPNAQPLLVGDHKKKVWSVSFSAFLTPASLASVDRNQIRFWPLTASLAEQVCDRVARNLTRDEWLLFVGSGIPYEPTCSSPPSER